MLLMAVISYGTYAQNTNKIIQAGNDAYKKADYKNAEKFYRQALSEDADNTTAKFNLGNALLKQNNATAAAEYFSQVYDAANDDAFKSQALYNKGLSMVKGQKLQGAIDAFKQSLLLDPDDNDTRENLQKAISELKKQQQNQPNNQKKNNSKNQPQQQPDKDLMEQKFEELRDKEKQLQKQLQKKNTNDQPDEDW